MDVGAQQGEGLLSYVSISGALSLLGSAGLYYLGNMTLRDAQELEKVKQLDKLSGGRGARAARAAARGTDA